MVNEVDVGIAGMGAATAQVYQPADPVSRMSYQPRQLPQCDLRCLRVEAPAPCEHRLRPPVLVSSFSSHRHSLPSWCHKVTQQWAAIIRRPTAIVVNPAGQSGRAATTGKRHPVISC